MTEASTGEVIFLFDPTVTDLLSFLAGIRELAEILLTLIGI